MSNSENGCVGCLGVVAVLVGLAGYACYDGYIDRDLSAEDQAKVLSGAQFALVSGEGALLVTVDNQSEWVVDRVVASIDVKKNDGTVRRLGPQGVDLTVLPGAVESGTYPLKESPSAMLSEAQEWRFIVNSIQGHRRPIRLVKIPIDFFKDSFEKTKHLFEKTKHLFDRS
jgi:hypothetical protein